MVDSNKLAFTFFQSGVDGTLLGNKATLLLENALSINALTGGSPTPPGSPAAGDTHIIGTAPTGAWSGHTGEIAVYDGTSWIFVTKNSSMTAYVVTASNNFVANGQRYAYSAAATLWYPMQDVWSATEHWTGKYTDGIKIWSKVIDFGTLPNAAPTTKSVAHSISPLLLTYKRAPIITDGRVSNGTISRNLNGRGLTITDVSIDATNVNITASGDESAYSAWLRLEYCKS